MICKLGLGSTFLTNCSNPVEHFLIGMNSPSRDTLREDENSWMWLVEQRNLERKLQNARRRILDGFTQRNLGEVGPIDNESHSGTDLIDEEIRRVLNDPSLPSDAELTVSERRDLLSLHRNFGHPSWLCTGTFVRTLQTTPGAMGST